MIMCYCAFSAILLCIAPPLSGGEYYYQNASDQLIFRYTVLHPFLADSPQFELTIHGDGATQIYIHPVIKIDGLRGRGYFKTRLAGERIQDLFGILEKEGLLTFKTEFVRKEKAANPRQGTATDPLIVRIEIRLDEYIGATGSTGPIEQHIQWADPLADAKRYPEVMSLQGLARGTRELTQWLCDLAREIEREEPGQ